MSGQEENTEFWNQFAGSSVANVFVILVAGLVWGMKKLCNRDSRCKSHIHCCCLDLDVRDKTIRDSPLDKDGNTEVSV